MKPPVCRLCGAAHWSNEPHAFEGKQARHELVPVMSKPAPNVTVRVTEKVPRVTKSVTQAKDVTKSVTGCPHCKAMRAEVEAQAGEIAHLKRRLAEAAGGKPAAMSPQERMKKMREKHKAKKAEASQQFKG